MPIATRTIASPRTRVTRRCVRVLVANDDADTRDLYRIYLQTVGMEVETATDGESAVELAKSGLPDVIVLDLGMPRLDGREAIRQPAPRIRATSIAMPMSTP